MIIRIVHGIVRPDAIHEFYRRVQGALPAIGAQDGLVDVRIGRQQSAGADDFVFATFWRDLESIYGWVGSHDLLSAPAMPGAYDDLLGHFEVQHYGAYDPEWLDAASQN